MWGSLSKTNHPKFRSSPITNTDFLLCISLCCCSHTQVLSRHPKSFFFACNNWIASWPRFSPLWRKRMRSKCPVLPKGFPLLSLTAHTEIVFLRLLLCHILSVFCMIVSFFIFSAWKNPVSPPPPLAAWVTETEKSEQCQQEFSPTAGTWTFSGGAQRWVTALKQARLIQSACSPWEGKHQKPVDKNYKNLQAPSVVSL